MTKTTQPEKLIDLVSIYCPVCDEKLDEGFCFQCEAQKAMGTPPKHGTWPSIKDEDPLTDFMGRK